MRADFDHIDMHRPINSLQIICRSAVLYIAQERVFRITAEIKRLLIGRINRAARKTQNNAFTRFFGVNLSRTIAFNKAGADQIVSVQTTGHHPRWKGEIGQRAPDGPDQVVAKIFNQLHGQPTGDRLQLSANVDLSRIDQNQPAINLTMAVSNTWRCEIGKQLQPALNLVEILLLGAGIPSRMRPVKARDEYELRLHYERLTASKCVAPQVKLLA